MKRNAVEIRGCHLFVVPRRKSIVEVEADIRAMSAKANETPVIVPFLREEGKRYGMKIATDIAIRASAFDPAVDHCCLIITQAAFQKLETAPFAGWHLKLDELMTHGNPSGSLFSPLMWSGLANFISIEPLTEQDLALGIDSDLRRIRRKQGLEAKDAFADPRLLREDVNLFERAASPIAVYTDATCIEDVGRRECRWCSPWTLDAVDGYATVEIAACDIEESLMHLIAPRPYTMVLCPTKTSSARIRIAYFDAGLSTCSAAFWQEERGRRNLVLIAREIARRGGVDFWTCNESAEEVLKQLMPKKPTTANARQDEHQLDDIDGTWVTQQQDGSNLYRNCTTCAIFASSKAQDHEAIFEILNPAATRTAISQGREGSLIFQFTSRGAIRNADFDGYYQVYLYDRQQAEALQDKLVAYGFPDTRIEHVDLEGFEDRVREPRGRKSGYATPDERHEARRLQNCERQRRFRAKKRDSASSIGGPSAAGIAATAA